MSDKPDDRPVWEAPVLQKSRVCAPQQPPRADVDDDEGLALDEVKHDARER